MTTKHPWSSRKGGGVHVCIAFNETPILMHKNIRVLLGGKLVQPQHAAACRSACFLELH